MQCEEARAVGIRLLHGNSCPVLLLSLPTSDPCIRSGDVVARKCARRHKPNDG